MHILSDRKKEERNQIPAKKARPPLEFAVVLLQYMLQQMHANTEIQKGLLRLGSNPDLTDLTARKVSLSITTL